MQVIPTDDEKAQACADAFKPLADAAKELGKAVEEHGEWVRGLTFPEGAITCHKCQGTGLHGGTEDSAYPECRRCNGDGYIFELTSEEIADVKADELENALKGK